MTVRGNRVFALRRHHTLQIFSYHSTVKMCPFLKWLKNKYILFKGVQISFKYGSGVESIQNVVCRIKTIVARHSRALGGDSLRMTEVKGPLFQTTKVAVVDVERLILRLCLSVPGRAEDKVG